MHPTLKNNNNKKNHWHHAEEINPSEGGCAFFKCNTKVYMSTNLLAS